MVVSAVSYLVQNLGTNAGLVWRPWREPADPVKRRTVPYLRHRTFPVTVFVR